MEYPVEIVACGLFAKSDIGINMVDLDPLPDKVARMVEDHWKVEMARNPRLMPGPLLAAKKITARGTRLTLECGVSNYKNFMGDYP